MKTINQTSSSNSVPSRATGMLSVLASLLCGLFSISCQSQSAPDPVSAGPPMKKLWLQVSSKPPTYYPRGTAADHPTSSRSGEWVYTKDAVDSRYFVPFRDLKLPRDLLVSEALAARSTRKLAEIRADDRRLAGKNAALAATAGPPLLFFKAVASFFE